MGKHALLIGIEDYPHLVDRDLKGPRNDVLEMANLLYDRFAFPFDHIQARYEGPVPRSAVIAAFEELCSRVQPKDQVVVFYSGHGSRTVWEGESRESLVPSDSGRPAPYGDGTENRDVVDREVDAWIKRLSRTTPHLTLIFDCCHSGSITRDPFESAAREAPPDRRPGPGTRSIGAGSETAPRERRRALVLSACRADETAKEYRPSIDGNTYHHGVFTYFLSRALQEAFSGTTWRGLFQGVAPRVAGVFASQHPQIEGPWDTELFGGEVRPPRAYVPVTAVEPDGAVTLGGGLVHGLTPGSLWKLHPSNVDTDVGDGLSATVQSVAPGSSVARVTGDGHRQVEAGWRAFLRRSRVERPGLGIFREVDDADEEERRILQDLLERSDLLRAVDDPSEADVAVRLLPARQEAPPGDPLPALGPLEEPTWTAVGKDGRLAVRSRARGHGAVQLLAADLEAVARYRGLLSIRHPDPSTSLADAVDFRLSRSVDGAVQELEPRIGDALPRVNWGDDGLEILVASRHAEPLWVTLLMFGCDYSVSTLLPHPELPEPGGRRLEPGQRLEIAADVWSELFDMERGFSFLRPEGFPWAAEPGMDNQDGLIHLRLMITESPVDFEFVLSGPARHSGEPEHPLASLTRLYARGQGTRSVEGGEGSSRWGVLQRTLRVGDPR